MEIVTGDQYLESLEKFVENQAERLIEGTLVLKLNPVGLRYVQSRLEALAELESLLAVAPLDYLRAYVSELGDHRALEQLRRILRLLPSLKMVSVLPPPVRDPTPLYLLPFGRLKVLELRGCDLSTSAAKGLLELRFTLEKLICHNSTDALRHVFASRITEIKDSPQWNRLSFVSCACNGLVLMDESLQLLPMVEVLDLSRNKFAKANNLRKCTKLKHLDLGFNSLRSIAAFSEVSGCQIVKLVLRNNALTTLRGIENMMSLEGLDVSYNIISNFSEVEILAGLPSLQNLWLEGNPICYARWFRAQVFSLFSDPEKLKLDEKRITANEFWKQQIIVASRHKQPASFGFYSPARDDADLEGSIYTKRKRISRLVNIDTEEQIKSICSGQDSSCDNEIQSRDENPITNEEAEIEDLMKRIESMKKERSDLWLQEFREWMNQTSDSVIDDSELRSSILSDKKEVHLESETQDEDLGETSRNVSDPNQLSGDESSTIVLESETFFADVSTVISGQRYVDRIGEAASKSYMGHAGGGTSVPIKLIVNQKEPRFLDNEWCVSEDAGDSCFSSLAVLRGDKVSAKNVILPTINDIAGSSPSLACPGSPPHFQEGVLHRRHNLEEDFLQLSAESLAVASSESNTSCSEEDSVEFGSSVTQVDRSATDNVSGSRWKSFFVGSYQDDASDFVSTNGRELEISTHACSGSFTDAICDDGTINFSKGKTDWLEKKKCRRKPRRTISLPEENDASKDTDFSKKSSDRVEICKSDVGHEGKEICCANDLCKSITAKNGGDSTTPRKIYMESCSGFSTSSDGKDEFIETFFNSNMADSGVNEISMLYVQCSCLFLEKSGYNERQVAILRSSEHKLYILLIVNAHDGSGTSLEMVGCHRLDDVRKVFVGLGLLFLRVYFARDTSYLFITRCLERSRDLLCVLDFSDLSEMKDYSLRSLEQIQVNLFQEHVCGGSKINIYQYSMVLFWHNNLKENLWLSRSLFMLEGHLLLCCEDFMQFGLSENSFSPPYFSLDSCCAIVNVSEMVIDTLGNMCVTLAFKCPSEARPLEAGYRIEEYAFLKQKLASDLVTWKLKWFSKESLFNFVALLKAIYAQATSCPLLVRYIS